jgi:hypothetical protein
LGSSLPAGALYFALYSVDDQHIASTMRKAMTRKGQRRSSQKSSDKGDGVSSHTDSVSTEAREQNKRKATEGEAVLTAKNYRLAKELVRQFPYSNELFRIDKLFQFSRYWSRFASSTMDFKSILARFPAMTPSSIPLYASTMRRCYVMVSYSFDAVTASCFYRKSWKI